MNTVKALKEIPPAPQYNEKDVLVVFGEVFDRGYVNGLIDAAQKRNMKVIYSTVGRRDPEGNLRPLTEEELHDKGQSPFINVPLEAGFDLEPANNGVTPVSQIQNLKMSEWNKAELNWDLVEESRQNGIARFRKYTTEYLKQLEPHISESRHVVFAHTMAGGFPRAKIVMPVTNRVFKGIGPRYASSEEFWTSQLGKLCETSFQEVTAETLNHLIDLSTPLRKKIEEQGNHVRYLAYGYHGTEVLHGNEYQWQSYSPYLQGFAKMRLEEIAENSWENNIKASVFNAPEILTNSSSIFLGLEVVLYPLLDALKKEGGETPQVQKIIQQCKALLKEDHNLEEVTQKTQSYLNNDFVKSWHSMRDWPQHNGPEQMELMRNSSQELIYMHKDSKNLMTSPLSEVVFKACGELMLAESWEPRSPVWWIGHDIVAKQTILLS